MPKTGFRFMHNTHYNSNNNKLLYKSKNIQENTK